MKIHIRNGTLDDYDQILELLILFYTDYYSMSVHLGIKDEDVRELLTETVAHCLTDGVSSVAEIDGKIEGICIGGFVHRSETFQPEYLHLPERTQGIEGFVSKLREGFWDHVPPKFDKGCFMEYAVVTPKARGSGLTDILLAEACKQCIEKGVFVVVSDSLSEKNTKWIQARGFVTVKYVPLDQVRDKHGRLYFEGRKEKMASLSVAYMDNTTGFYKSKM